MSGFSRNSMRGAGLVTRSKSVNRAPESRNSPSMDRGSYFDQSFKLGKIDGLLCGVACGFLVFGCASKPSHWEDMTKNGRGHAQLTMDRGQCRLLSQDAGYRKQLSVNQQNANECAGTPAGCETLGALQGASVAMAGNNAFNACMNTRGWALVAGSSMPRQRCRLQATQPSANEQRYA
jgi:hypothetical protein